MRPIRKTRQLSPLFKGVITGLPFAIVVFPFGLVFGAVATNAGFDVLQAFMMTALVMAGASQFTAIALLQDQAPTLIVILVSLTVNLRMAMYSASLSVHIGQAKLWEKLLVSYLMVDQAYAASILEYQKQSAWSVNQKVKFYFGVALGVAPFWYLGTLLGAIIGAKLPANLSLDFAVPIAFIALLAPMLNSLPKVVAALVSTTLGLTLANLPFNSAIMIAAVSAMMAGVQVEKWLDKQTRKKAQSS